MTEGLPIEVADCGRLENQGAWKEVCIGLVDRIWDGLLFRKGQMIPQKNGFLHMFHMWKVSVFVGHLNSKGKFVSW